jgi:hydroxymethylpyrimidine/phosphomethylpyrimidine kinase
MSVVTSVVAENTSRVISVFNMPADEVKKQIDAVFEDIAVDAVKLGMLPTAEIISAVADSLSRYKPPFTVCDPVMVATSGDALSDGSTVSALREKLFPIVDLITPNIPEAEVISGVKINGIDDFDKAAEVIMGMGVKNLLLKGGHFMGDCIDILYTSEKNDEDSFCNYMFCEKRIDSPNTHGTGCTLSSAIAANLANGLDMAAAVEAAKHYVTKAIEKSFTVGGGHSPVNHFYEYYDMKGIE